MYCITFSLCCVVAGLQMHGPSMGHSLAGAGILLKIPATESLFAIDVIVLTQSCQFRWCMRAPVLLAASLFIC